MSTIEVAIQDRVEAGGCNACTDRVDQVYVVTFQRTKIAGQSFRLCETCRRLLIQVLLQAEMRRRP
jgi:hypothetical protein